MYIYFVNGIHSHRHKTEVSFVYTALYIQLLKRQRVPRKKKKAEQNSGENSTWFSTEKLIISRMPWVGSILCKHVPVVVTIVFPLKWYWKVLKAPQTHKMGENHVPKPKAPSPHLIEAEGSLAQSIIQFPTWNSTFFFFASLLII